MSPNETNPLPPDSTPPSDAATLPGPAAGSAAPGLAGDSRLGAIPVEVRVVVGHASPTVGELSRLGQDAVLTLDSKVDDPVELYVGDTLFARGELQETAGGGIAVRLTELAGSGA